ncbi:hypothetical protein KKE19_02695 [Patescibacteria group bacterium]|nr:hypothetical protein [Patescibacteria group bacterium]MBU4367745.1 hypothetical protein [Patescibacteria group bacterium]MBU4461805.1 hypothetical protein [Patescibacteria group bacterium]MCG2700064.1 hypothetical protein [Candidatus Parcubacteria bacterium]
MIEKNCDFCNKTFLVHPYRGKIAHFCSKTCYNNQRKKSAYGVKICPFCKKEFTPNRNTRQNKYCSKECSILGRRKHLIEGERVKWTNGKRMKVYKWRGEKICIYCGKKFKYASKNIHQKYCSVICQVKNRAYRINENFFEKINSEGRAYLLGLIFSDGNISSKKYYTNISSKDQELIEMCKKLLDTNRPIYHYKNSFSLLFGNQKIHESLKKHGVLERKSWKDYSLPSIPKNLWWHFIRGFFDGDGSFYIDDRDKYKYLCASFSCGSQKFLGEIKKCLEKYHIIPHKIRFDKKPDNKGCWQLKITRKKDIKMFIDYLYKNSNYFLNRKYKIVKSFHG